MKTAFTTIRNLKLSAGALSYAILLILFLTIVVGFFALRIHLHFIIQHRAEDAILVDDNINSVKELILTLPDNFPFNQQIYMDLYNEGRDSIFVKRMGWGLFEIVSVEAWKGQVRKHKTFILGSERLTGEPALYVTNHNSYVYTLGNNTFNGEIFVPGGVIKPGFLKGENNGLLKIQGTVFNSGEKLKSLNKRISEFSLNQLVEHYWDTSSHSIPNTNEIKSMENSFKNETKAFYFEGKTELSDIDISGRIVLLCPHEVYIDGNCAIKESIIIARKIIFKKGFSGAVQAFASDTIITEQECNFYYPSTLVVSGANKILLSLGKGSNMEGALVVNNKSSELESAVLKIEEDCTVFGTAYSNDLLEVKGDVFGAAYANKLLHTVDNQSYYNFIQGATIDMNELPAYYKSPILFEQQEYSFIEWK